MGSYSRELFGLPIDDTALRRWVAPPPPTEEPVPCADCPARASLIIGCGADRVRQQLRLYHHGWRQVPDSGRHYCPRCSVARGLS